MSMPEQPQDRRTISGRAKGVRATTHRPAKGSGKSDRCQKVRAEQVLYLPMLSHRLFRSTRCNVAAPRGDKALGQENPPGSTTHAFLLSFISK
jgi:hypothetical protein